MKVETLIEDDFQILTRLKTIVKEKAKYQKVMLLFDATANPSIMAKIGEIKEFCIFNKLNINGDIEEIYNGYKMLIILSCTNAFIAKNIRLSEFVNIFMPTDEYFLPYFLNEFNVLNQNEGYLFLKPTSLDISILTSLAFNRFYNYLNNLMQGLTNKIELSFAVRDITQNSLLNLLSCTEKDLKFVDSEILKQTSLGVSDLIVLDYVLIFAFYVLINSIKNSTIQMVDVYKSARDDIERIDKYYTMANNGLFFNLITINFNQINILLNKTKEIIAQSMQFLQIETPRVENVVAAVRDYCKSGDGLFGYLYLYDLFDV